MGPASRCMCTYRAAWALQVDACARTEEGVQSREGVVVDGMRLCCCVLKEAAHACMCPAYVPRVCRLPRFVVAQRSGQREAEGAPVWTVKGARTVKLKRKGGGTPFTHRHIARGWLMLDGHTDSPWLMRGRGDACEQYGAAAGKRTEWPRGSGGLLTTITVIVPPPLGQPTALTPGLK